MGGLPPEQTTWNHLKLEIEGNPDMVQEYLVKNLLNKIGFTPYRAPDCRSISDFSLCCYQQILIVHQMMRKVNLNNIG
jgi:hypothetical protein